MKHTYRAFKLMSERRDTPLAIIWWHDRLQCTNKAVLDSLKTHEVNGMNWHKGEEFFNSIPEIYRSGYLYVLKAEVTSDGKEV